MIDNTSKPCPWCGRDMNKRSEADKDNEGHAWYRDDCDYIQGLIRANEFMKMERNTHAELIRDLYDNLWVHSPKTAEAIKKRVEYTIGVKL